MKEVILASTIGTVCVLYSFCNNPKITKQSVSDCIRSLSILAWFPLVLSLLDVEDRTSPRFMVPSAIMAAMWGVDTYMSRTLKSSKEDVPASLVLQSSSITSLTFGLSGLLRSTGSKKYTHLFLYAIMGCLVLVMPTHNLEEDSFEAWVFSAFQKSFLMLCIGLLVTGVSFTHQCSDATCEQ
jgi:hypothetical protein